MKVTSEMIYDVEHTVVWHSEAFCNTEGITENRCSSWFWQPLYYGGYSLFMNCPNVNSHEATALPPLPKHPKLEHADLLRLYAAHGIFAVGRCKEEYYDYDCDNYRFENEILIPTKSDVIYHDSYNQYYSAVIEYFKTQITHAVTKTGEQVEVAIYDNTAQAKEE